METVATSEESVRDSLDDTMSKVNSTEVEEDKNTLPSTANDATPTANTIDPGSVDWAAITGLKVKQYTEAELEAFRKPFHLGWKREVVLRGTVTHSGKKIGDVYYFLPEQKVKLRSYVGEWLPFAFCSFR